MITTQQLSDAMGADIVLGLTDDNNDGECDESVVAAAAGAAEQEVRDAVARSGAAPPDELTGMLADIALTLAVERLFLRRRSTLPGAWAERARRARLILDEIAAGRRGIADMPRPSAIAGSSCDGPLHRLYTMKGM